jgi:2-desacetyl-2-hydroxyethyl bacteriochlorophyllide A dehydrogenase
VNNQTMLAYVIEKKRLGVVKEVPIPKPGDHDVLIKVMAAGLCGTDAHIFLGEYYSSFPMIPGHEFAGIVAKTDKNVKQFQEGQSVVADPNIFCEKCHFCKQNMQNFCLNFQAAGVTRDGAFAEYVVVPEGCVFEIENIGFTAGALVEPLSCVVYGQMRARPQVGDSVLIFGAGPIGLLHLQLAKRNGVSYAAVVDIKAERLEIAKKLGANDVYLSNPELDNELHKEFPFGFNLVIDTSGVPKVVENAVAHVKNSGTMLIFGVCPPETKINISPYEIYKRDLKIIGSFALKKTFQPAINLIKNQMIDVSVISGDQITLKELPRQMDKLVTGKTAMKTIIIF